MSITIRMPDDMHVHLRQGKTLKQVLPWTAHQFARALVMPNTVPPISSTKLVNDYRDEIKTASPEFEPLLAFKIMADMNARAIDLLAGAGVIAGKLYPQGSTTNTSDGPADIKALFPVFAAMQEHTLILSVHAEDPSAPALMREQAFLPVIAMIAEAFPGLKIVIEHVSSAEAVDFVIQAGANIAASVTLHHLLFTIDDLIGGSLNPDLFCKPVLKMESDRDSIRQAVFTGNRKFFFGSDSAPHSRDKKLGEGAAGTFSAPVLLPALAGLFEEYDTLDRLEDFVSSFGADFYGLERNSGKITLEKCLFEVPAAVGDMVPLFAGKNLEWRVKRD
ncbi:MAG: dihydroorotase [Spirochaetales bacterium]|nr:dihydroorotase [Spirochaetales bacterium]